MKKGKYKKEETDESRKKDETKAQSDRVAVDGAGEPASTRRYFNQLGVSV